jgi:methanethiol S-methyltransferase
MQIVSLFYAAFGYLTLLGAILWGMLFFGGGVVFPNMDAGGNVAPLRAACVDLGLLLLLALLHRSVSRGMLRRVAPWSLPSGLERSTRAWAAAGVLLLIYAGWQPLPQALWSAGGPLRWALSALFYVAWTLILIGALLVSHLDMFETAGATGAAPSAAADDGGPAHGMGKALFGDTFRQPLYIGILIAVWVTPVMTVGHLVLAATVTGYLVFDGLWAARKSGAARESRGTFLLQGERIAR